MTSYSPYSSQNEHYGSPPITIILTVTLLIFFFAGFLSIYFCRCFMQSILHTLQLRNSPSGNLVGATTTTNHGLDPSLIQAFPTFAYSTVKDFRCEKYGLECAICLAEFEDDSMLRLLTVCYHVFHQECIDLWLQSHKTCPVCRRDLDLPEKPLEKSPLLVRSNSMNDISDNGSVLEDAISIYIKEDDNNNNDNENQQVRRERERQEGGAVSIAIKDNETWDQKLEKFSRSHSTGHSILRMTRDDDKHTLRLPEHVKIKLLRCHHHNWTGSCIPFGDYSASRNGVVLGEVAESSAGVLDKV